LSISVDPELAEAGQEAVATGRATSLSAWVNNALHRQMDHERRLQALEEFLTAYEATEGEITESEVEAATRHARERAVVVRGRPRR